MGLRSQSLYQAQLRGRGGGLHFRRRGWGVLCEEEVWSWIWSSRKGIGSDGGGGGVCLEGSKEDEKSQQGSGDIVLGGCGPEWTNSI